MSWSFATTVAIQSGKTTAICKAAKEIDAVVVCHNQQEANRVHKEHGVRTISLRHENKRGMKGPILFDTHAVSVLCLDYERVISNLVETNAELQGKLQKIREMTHG